MKRLLVLSLTALLLVPGAHALAGKKKGPKPYKSEEVSIAVPHPVFYGQSGSPQNVTIKEFETTCATPTTQGFDAHIFEVPAAYQKLNAAVAAKGTAGAYDLDLFFYDSSCAITGASQAEGTDELGVMPAGTVWVAMHNYLGDPNVSAYIELRPTDF